MVLCRGHFHVIVHEAKNLPDKKTFLSQAGSFVSGLFGQKEKADYVSSRVKVRIGALTLGKTSPVDDDDDRSPVWDESFRGDIAVEGTEITFDIVAAETGQTGCYAKLALYLKDIIARPDEPQSWRILSLKGNPTSEDPEWFPLANSKGKQIEGAYLRVTVNFTNDLSTPDIGDTYFSVSEGNKVTLYQDAETPAEPLHGEIVYEDDLTYEPASAWRDLLKAIKEATVLIYFVGWSVWTELVMIRDEDDETLGQILTRKAEDGVTVLGMVWDEKTSNQVLPGLMGTHDEETANYFKDTKVHAIMVSRHKSAGVMSSQFSSTCYSHHQKAVVVDVPVVEGDEESGRRLITFLGGLDMTNGRYDIPSHPLFQTLQTLHKNDFYQNCVTVRPDCGPRQPWHDIHCKVEGPLALDVLKNFEERWVTQADASIRGNLVDISEREDLDRDYTYTEDNSWNCQLFRSITRDSVAFPPDKKLCLTKKAKIDCEESIHRCYLHQIRRAQHYIYIENQYFLGSAYAWVKGEKPKAHHVIPFEITCKIVEKIEKGERFSAYINVPMYPEGDPATNVVQEILHWQKSTMEMMYSRIAAAIKKAGIDATPRDYLSFFCLGNREVDLPEDLGEPEEDSVEAKLRATRRFMIYIHSKMMIVDDSYIIIGSANINQRSMGGTRDTEIAVGTYQPAYMADEESVPKGAIHAFRKSLWAEHTGVLEDCYDDPASVECMQKVVEIAQSNWEKYVDEEVQELSGHLLLYPFQVDEDGNISHLPGCRNFPDTKANILGSASRMLPNKLTT